MSKNKFKILIFAIAIWLFPLKPVLAIPAMQQRCEPSTSCTIGEYVFDDDGHTAISTDNYCKITITDPGDTKIVDAVNMPDKNDGWYYYTTSSLGTEGLYRSVICCDVGNPGELCIDKTFIVGTSFNNLPEKIWSYTGSALDTAGNAIAKIWSYSGGRTLTAIGALAADIWNNTYAPTRRLTDKTLTGGGNIATESYVDTAKTDIITEVTTNRTLITALNNISAADVWGYANRGLTQSVTLSNPQQVWDVAKASLTTVGSVGEQVANNLDATVSSRSTLTASDVWLAATRTLTSNANFNDPTSTAIAAAVWANATRDLTNYGNNISAADVWNVLSSSLLTVGSIGKQVAENVDTTISSRASQSSVDTLQADVTYIRSKADSIYTDTQYISGRADTILSKWSSYSAADIIGYVDEIETRVGTTTDASSADTIFGRTKYLQEKWGTQTAQTIYDKADSTLSAVGAVQAELGYNGKSTTAYDDFQLVKGYVDELEGYIGTPLDTATTTLFGAINDVQTKLDKLDTLETKLNTVGTVVDLIQASLQSPAETPQSTEGGSGQATLSGVYSLLQDLQSEVGYKGTGSTVHEDLTSTKYSLGALPNQLSKPLYEVLTGLSTNIKALGGETAHSLNDAYKVIESSATDLTYVIDKVTELKAMLEVNKTLVSQAFNQPIIQTWFTTGSVILNIMVVNPPDAARTVNVKEYLPKEIREEHIIKIEDGLTLEYDSALDTYYVSGQVDLAAGAQKVFQVEAEDIFKISEEEISSLRAQSDTLMEPLKGNSYFAQASILKSELDANLDSIQRTQAVESVNVERRISVYRNNEKDLQKVKDNIDALKKIVSEASGQGGVFGSLFGVSTTMTWAVIIIVVVGIAVLMIFLYSFLMRARALEHHISGGKKLKAPPLIDLKKHFSRKRKAS